MQQALNELDSDNRRKNSKKILVDMLDKAIDSDLLVKNVAKQLNTVISKEEKKERRVLTRKETEIFLTATEGTFYCNLYVVALETGMRIGELMGRKCTRAEVREQVLSLRAVALSFQNCPRP